MKAVETTNGTLIPIDAIMNSLNELHYTMPGYNRVIECKTYKRVRINAVEYVLVPRAWARSKCTNVTVSKNAPQYVRNAMYKNPADNPVKLLPGQDALIDRSVEALKRRKSVLLNLGTGSGKTFIGLHLLARLGYRALFVAPMRSVVSQTKKIVAQYGLSNLIEVGTYKLAEKMLSKRPASGESKDTPAPPVGAIFIDEIDNISTETRAHILWLACKCKYIIGASATIDERNDGADAEYWPHFQDAIITEPGAELAVTCNARIVRYRGPQKVMTRKIAGKAVPSAQDTIIYSYDASENRYQAVINELHLALDKGHTCVLIFSRFKKVTSRLYELLAPAPVVNNATTKHADTPKKKNIIVQPIMSSHKYNNKEYKIAKVTGDQHIRDVNAAMESANILLCTYDFAATGVSIPRATGLVLADAKKTRVTQVIGRILRRWNPENDAKPRFVSAIYDGKTFISRWTDEAVRVFREKNWRPQYCRAYDENNNDVDAAELYGDIHEEEFDSEY